MKKSLVLFLALLMALSSLGNVAFAEEKVTITFGCWGDGYEKQTVEDTIKEFGEKNNVNVELAYMPDDYATKMIAMAASNTMPDTGYCPDEVVVEWAMNGMIYNLNELMTSRDIGGRLDQIYHAPNGDVLGVSVGGGASVLYYNRQMFDDLGLDLPPYTTDTAWTWDEFVEVCKKLTVDDQGKHPDDEGFNPEAIVTYGVDIGFSPFQLVCFLKSNGGNVVSADGSKVELDSPESIEVLQAISDLINVYHVAPPPGSAAKDMDMSSAFLSNTVAMVVGGTWSTQALAIAQKEDGILFDCGVLPKFKEPVTCGLGTPIVIYKDTKHYDICLKLVEAFLDPNSTLPLIHSGLWMTTEDTWFTDDNIIQNEWLTTDVYPEHYTPAVIKYLWDALVPQDYYNMAYVNQINDLYIPALQSVWLGNSSVEDAVAGVVPEIQKICDRWTADKTNYTPLVVGQ